MRKMTKILCLMFIPFALLVAYGVPLSALPCGELPNSEVSTNVALNVDYGRLEKLTFSLELNASASNSLSIAVGTNVVRRVDVVSGGMVESLPRQLVGGQYSSTMSICAAREYASIVPGVGRFWWADTVATERDPPNQVKLTYTR